MSAKLLEGKPIAEEIRARVKVEVEGLKAKGKAPKLAAILAGDNPGAKFYAGAQEKACAEVGIEYELEQLAADVTQADLEGAIGRLNSDESVHGLLLLMPVPKGLNGAKAQALIDPRKDVDGVSPANLGRVVLGQPRLAPCTAMSVIELVRASGVEAYGKEVVVVGSSEIVGKPAALLLMDKYITADAEGKTDKLAGATVTVCHIGTSERGDLAAHTRGADILVTAVGVKPGLISGEMVKPGAIVIDVATIRVKDGETGKTKTYGDVDFEAAKEKVAAITPVPGGVGVVTTAILLRNTLEAAKWQVEG
ncbi:MAG: bifunctional 5,10-methylenetetrahydrofolate dehydrogenase/5,10-methenyltetrahydrofolate cyclohydrolase [Armatimonadota bacterium]|nr:MAG: bifunctional 5,10-methylenetetrahydrofolate dehydrogenase/5,10-methenyltetrahydrofolate cyclohydrolase [Armatimonadota bacterium]